MGQLYNISKVIKTRSLTKLKTFTDNLDIAFKGIILSPQVTLKEIACLAAQRLATFISVSPAAYRQELLDIAIQTLQKYSKIEK